LCRQCVTHKEPKSHLGHDRRRSRVKLGTWCDSWLPCRSRRSWLRKPASGQQWRCPRPFFLWSSSAIRCTWTTSLCRGFPIFRWPSGRWISRITWSILRRRSWRSTTVCTPAVFPTSRRRTLSTAWVSRRGPLCWSFATRPIVLQHNRQLQELAEEQCGPQRGLRYPRGGTNHARNGRLDWSRGSDCRRREGFRRVVRAAGVGSARRYNIWWQRHVGVRPIATSLAFRGAHAGKIISFAMGELKRDAGRHFFNCSRPISHYRRPRRADCFSAHDRGISVGVTIPILVSTQTAVPWSVPIDWNFLWCNSIIIILWTCDLFSWWLGERREVVCVYWERWDSLPRFGAHGFVARWLSVRAHLDASRRSCFPQPHELLCSGGGRGDRLTTVSGAVDPSTHSCIGRLTFPPASSRPRHSSDKAAPHAPHRVLCDGPRKTPLENAHAAPISPTTQLPRTVEVALLDLKRKTPLQKVPESVSILVWPPVALVGTVVSERRLGSPSCSPPRPPVAESCRTVLFFTVPLSCRLSCRPLYFQAPWAPTLDVNNYMVREGLHTIMMCGQQDRKTRA